MKENRYSFLPLVLSVEGALYYCGEISKSLFKKEYEPYVKKIRCGKRVGYYRPSLERVIEEKAGISSQNIPASGEAQNVNPLDFL